MTYTKTKWVGRYDAETIQVLEEIHKTTAYNRLEIENLYATVKDTSLLKKTCCIASEKGISLQMVLDIILKNHDKERNSC